MANAGGTPIKNTKKLIETVIPLEAVNAASAREKSIRHGHPSTLHLWWARRPLAAARAVLFAQMVDDPESDPERFPTKEAQERERERLLALMEELVVWENTTNEEVLGRAREEIRRSWRRTCALNAGHPRAAEWFDPDRLPAFHDPFAGGGALPLEAQRLGLESWASDLNPVAVLINKAMIELPPRFAGCSPVHPDARADRELIGTPWRGARGLAEDVRRYGRWMRDEAERRIGLLYPRVTVTPEMVRERPDLKPYEGQALTVIAWLWARTVRSPNPAFANVEVPLASTFMLSTKKGREAWVEPVIEGDTYRFVVRTAGAGRVPPDSAKNGTKLARGAHFRCLLSDMPIASEHIYVEANAGRMGSRLMAIVVEGERGRVYIAPTQEQENIVGEAAVTWKPAAVMPDNPRWFSPPLYGLTTFGDLFTPRQLVALTTFSDLVREAVERVRRDAEAASAQSGGLPQDDRPLREDGRGPRAYAEAVGVYLGFAVDKSSDYWSSICSWIVSRETIRSTFGRQAIPMMWDFAEANPMSDSSGNFILGVEQAAKMNEGLGTGELSHAIQADATVQSLSVEKIVSTDPPYYDNIGYADLSDFFYVWLRRSLAPIYPDLFATLGTPKAEELVATPYRHGSPETAEAFFMEGMTRALGRLAEQAHPAFPVTVYYAFKQSEMRGGDMCNTGWEAFLEALVRAGFAVMGTWPMRTERGARVNSLETNALASSVVLACRRRAPDAPSVTRREFLAELKRELPPALRRMQAENIAPVDLAQAAIGPGMAAFTRHGAVLDAQGACLSVRDALTEINNLLDETLAEREGDFDAGSRWALAWFEQYGFGEGNFGDAETLARAKNTSVQGLVEAGILESRLGRVRLLPPSELPADWKPAGEGKGDNTVWETVHHLIRVLESGGERPTAERVARLGGRGETARELAYRLYLVCERLGRAAEALSYNALVRSWPELTRLARDPDALRSAQDSPSLF
mgnify:CR=1 FL=1